MEIQEYVPYLSVDDGPKAVEFYSRVFDTEPWVLLNMPDGRVMHCEFRIGNTRLFLSDELPEHGGTPSPKTLGSTAVAIHIYVTDCDNLTEDMANNGAEVLMQPADMFWGVRFARVRDPFGHEWGIATQIQEISPEEIKSVVSKMFESEEQQWRSNIREKSAGSCKPRYSNRLNSMSKKQRLQHSLGEKWRIRAKTRNPDRDVGIRCYDAAGEWDGEYRLA